MPSRTATRLAYAAVCAAWVTAGTVLARPVDKQSHFTFRTPVEVPGVMLPAGKYVFRVLESPGRNLVQILSVDGSRSYAVFFARRRPQRRDTPHKAELRFMDAAAGMPLAIETWWYPGERTGYGFVYPPVRARLRAVGVPVRLSSKQP